MNKIIRDINHPAIPIQPDDLLRITAISTLPLVSIVVSGYAINEHNEVVPYSFDLSIPSDHTLTSNTNLLGYHGLISLSISLSPNNDPTVKVFCKAEIIRKPVSTTSLKFYTLLSGFINQQNSIYFHPLEFNNGESFKHIPTVLVNQALAPGAPFVYLVPSFSFLKLNHIDLVITTSATVINRFFRLIVTTYNGGDIIYSSPAHQLASTTIRYSVSPHFVNQTVVTNGGIQVALPHIHLRPIDQLRIDMINFQIGDTIEKIDLYATETLSSA